MFLPQCIRLVGRRTLVIIMCWFSWSCSSLCWQPLENHVHVASRMGLVTPGQLAVSAPAALLGMLAKLWARDLIHVTDYASVQKSALNIPLEYHQTGPIPQKTTPPHDVVVSGTPARTRAANKLKLAHLRVV